jgi:hypothetical protein
MARHAPELVAGMDRNTHFTIQRLRVNPEFSRQASQSEIKTIRLENTQSRPFCGSLWNGTVALHYA